jgi:hypothetical protein
VEALEQLLELLKVMLAQAAEAAEVEQEPLQQLQKVELVFNLLQYSVAVYIQPHINTVSAVMVAVGLQAVED